MNFNLHSAAKRHRHGGHSVDGMPWLFDRFLVVWFQSGFNPASDRFLSGLIPVSDWCPNGLISGSSRTMPSRLLNGFHDADCDEYEN